MKRLIIIITVFAFFANITAQNIMSYTKQVYTGDSLRVDTFDIDITYLKDNSLINAPTADYSIEYKNIPNTINISNNRFALLQVFANVAGWGTSEVNNLYIGNYVGSGLNINQINLFDLYYSNNINKRDELEVRFRHELNGNMANMVDSICVGYSDNTKKVCGILTDYNQITGIAYLKAKEGNYAFIVDYYTVTLADEEEIKRKY